MTTPPVATALWLPAGVSLGDEFWSEHGSAYAEVVEWNVDRGLRFAEATAHGFEVTGEISIEDGPTWGDVAGATGRRVREWSATGRGWPSHEFDSR